MKFWVPAVLLLAALAGCDGKPEGPSRPLDHAQMSERDRLLSGVFQGERNSATGKVTVELALNRDSTFRMTTQAVTTNPDEFATPIVDVGNWSREGDVVTAKVKFSGETPVKLDLQYSVAANKLTLLTKDEVLYPGGMTLTKVESLISKKPN